MDGITQQRIDSWIDYLWSLKLLRMKQFANGTKFGKTTQEEVLWALDEAIAKLKKTKGG